MGHNRDTGIEYGPRVTYAQAAAILGIHVSNVAGLVASGHLSSRGGRGVRGALLRQEVEDLAHRRRAAAAAVAERRALREAERASRARAAGPPDDHRWLTSVEAAAVLGVTPQAVAKRLRKGRMPGVWHGRQWWIRAEHAQLLANTKRTATAEAVPAVLRQIRGDQTSAEEPQA